MRAPEGLTPLVEWEWWSNFMSWLILVQVKGAMALPAYQVAASVRLKVPWASHGRQFLACLLDGLSLHDDHNPELADTRLVANTEAAVVGGAEIYRAARDFETAGTAARRADLSAVA